MKILELEIENIRGVRNKISLKPEGDNFVIYGPNGTGKSAIVDAIEFLFTGDISRLSGRGTQGISLKKHGPHIDMKPENARVKAKIQFPNLPEPVFIERYMNKPKELIHPQIDDEAFYQTLEIANKGHILLSRSEILKFVAAESGKRAEDVQIILNLNKIEEIRKILISLKSDAEKALQKAADQLKSSESDIRTTASLDIFSENQLLGRINKARLILGGAEVEDINLDQLKDGIQPPNKIDKVIINHKFVSNAVDEITHFLKEDSENIFENEINLRRKAEIIKSDKQLKRDLTGIRLLNLGISLLDDNGICPLCLTRWEPRELENLLRNRILKAKEAERIESEFSTIANSISTKLSELIANINCVINAANVLSNENIKDNLKSWLGNLTSWRDDLTKPVDEYPSGETVPNLSELMAYEGWFVDCEQIIKEISEKYKLSLEQEEWDFLTKIELLLKYYFESKNSHESMLKYTALTRLASETFTTTKDQILENLYDSISVNFTKFYKLLHENDECDFGAELKPDGAKLDFQVDFYKRGYNHPKALHSEGHQDSMGLCLFLAINENISQGKVKLVILDDVVMSIDSNHRRNVSQLLRTFFPDRQFLITTHNSTWLRQLNSDGIVKTRNLITFHNWSLETGPIHDNGREVWDDIKNKVTNNEVTSAAAQMREYLEFFYDDVCSLICARTIHKNDGRHEFGDLLNSAKNELINSLSKAKKAANSWNNKDKINEIQKIEADLKDIIIRSKSEQWVINDNVHYSRWKDFTKEDFLPIVEAFQDLEYCFRCSNCKTIIFLTFRDNKPSSIKCHCGNFNLNLELKAK
jgi:DNA repair exonuclease SbcCD ATPase subunit